MRFSGPMVIIIAFSVAAYLISNTISGKPVTLFELPFGFLGSNLVVVSASVIVFPLTFIISDILTEVYGFRVARGAIWLGLGCSLMLTVFILLVEALPGAHFWDHQSSYESILGATPWIAGASVLSYTIGEFSNAIVMVTLKNRTNGRKLWLRTISSTVVAQGVNSFIFYMIAFGASGAWTWEAAFNGAILGWIVKTLYEVAATPFVYIIVNRLKWHENIDIFDNPKDLNPLGFFGQGYESIANAARFWTEGETPKT